VDLPNIGVNTEFTEKEIAGGKVINE